MLPIAKSCYAIWRDVKHRALFNNMNGAFSLQKGSVNKKQAKEKAAVI